MLKRVRKLWNKANTINTVVPITQKTEILEDNNIQVNYYNIFSFYYKNMIIKR